jgi:hypothetical protein
MPEFRTLSSVAFKVPWHIPTSPSLLYLVVFAPKLSSSLRPRKLRGQIERGGDLSTACANTRGRDRIGSLDPLIRPTKWLHPF